MEGRKRRGGTTCIPRRRRSHRRASPASLLDRFREVVFRLIMMSASASRGGGAQAGAGMRQGRGAHGDGGRVHRSDSYRSEAVEECIEFFKRSASGVDTKEAAVDGDAVKVVAFRPYQPCEA